jgi:hypothetical protein
VVIEQMRAMFICYAIIEWNARRAFYRAPWHARTNPGPTPRELTMTVTESGEVIRFTIPPHARRRASKRSSMRSRVRFNDVQRAAKRAMEIA